MILIDRQTAAVTSNPFKVSRDSVVGVKATGLSGAEVVTLQTLVGDSFQDVKDSAGATVTMTATSPHIRIEASGTYRVTKGVTASTTVQAD